MRVFPLLLVLLIGSLLFLYLSPLFDAVLVLFLMHFSLVTSFARFSLRGSKRRPPIIIPVIGCGTIQSGIVITLTERTQEAKVQHNQ